MTISRSLTGLRALVLAVLLGGSAGFVAAAEEPAGAACLDIVDDEARLTCFDHEVGAAARGDEAVTEAELPAASPEPDTPVTARPGAGPSSLIDAAWGFEPDSKEAYVRLYRPNYILFARYSDNVNLAPFEPLLDEFADEYDFEDLEAKFQLSFKARLATTEDRRWGLWFAYTQQSLWQVYNEDISRPFRETNYEPEVFGSFRPGVEFGGWNWNLLNFGFNHQSNGRADPISRSWDRLFVEAGVERGDFALLARAWTRIELGEYEDDNPGITDYLGYGELTAFYRWHEHSFTLWGRGNLTTGKGAAQFTWATPRLLGPVRGYVQVFTGYGETMIDYDWNQTTIGVGVTLNDRL